MRISRVDCGFTLVELVVTLVIIGVLAAVSAPIFFTRQTFAEQGFVNEARAVVRYGQKLAVSSGCSVQVQISGGNTIALRRSNNAANCNDGVYNTAVDDPANRDAGFTRVAPSGVALGATASPFVFTPLGNVAGNGNVTITAGTRSFVVAGATGFVQ